MMPYGGVTRGVRAGDAGEVGGAEVEARVGGGIGSVGVSVGPCRNDALWRSYSGFSIYMSTYISSHVRLTPDYYIYIDNDSTYISRIDV